MTTLPPLDGKATLDVTDFRKGIQSVLSDLRSVQDLAKKVGTIRISADLSAGKDVQRTTRAIRDAVQEMVPTDMQRRIDSMFGAFSVGAGAARQSASAFEADAAALRARIDQLSRAVSITRAEFQSGFGEASPQEITKLSVEMNRLGRELETVGKEARENFGEYSREAQKVANANRLAQTTAAAARGEITRLGLASQVKLGVGSALSQYGPQAGLAANGLFQFAQASDKARIAQGLFGKTLEKTGQDVGQSGELVAKLQDTLGVSADAAREGLRGLLRQGFDLQGAYTALRGAGASALAAGRSAQEGMDAFVNAVTTGTSVALNQIGVAENLSTFLQKEAKLRGVNVDQLDKQARAQAALNLITTATADEVEDLSTLLGGVAGNVNSATRELDTATKQLGAAFIPVVTNGARVLTRFVGFFNQIPDAGKQAVIVLGASAVAIGLLYGPVSNLARAFGAITKGLQGVRAASAAASAGTTLIAEGAGNAAQSADAFVNLAQRTQAFYTSARLNLVAFTTSTLLASGATNVLSVAFIRAAASAVVFSTALGTLTVGAIAGLAALGALVIGGGVLYSKFVAQTTAIYEEADRANEASFDRIMKRVQALRAEGTELSRAKARVLLLTQSLADAQTGPIIGTNFFTGERIYGPRDEAQIRKLNADLAAARQNVTALHLEAQRRGQLNLKLTEDQTRAVKTLRESLEGRQFDLKVSGLSDFQADLARLGRDFDTLRETFKKPFTVGGQLLDPAQTPALRDGLAELDTQKRAEQAALRKTYADEAAKAARQSALDVQTAEIQAMVEGKAKKAALRAQETQQITRDAKEKAEQYKDFPDQARQIEEDARDVIAARRAGWAQEDLALAREHAARVQAAELSAQDATIAAMSDGLDKKDAVRARDLENLRLAIQERADALKDDPEARAEVLLSGQQEVSAKIRQQNRERLQDVRDLQRQVTDAEREAQSAIVAGMEDGRAKREASRALDVQDLRASLAAKVQALAGDPEAQGRVAQAGRTQVLGLLRQQARERVEEERSAQAQVAAARKSAREATISAIQDEDRQRRASRQQEAADFQKSVQDRLEQLRGYPRLQAQVLEAARVQAQAVGQRHAAEDLREARERARRIADAYLQAQDAQAAALDAGRSNQAAQFELSLSRQLAAARDNALEVAELEAGAVSRRAALAETAARDALARSQARLVTERDRALDDDKLTVQERQALWAKYYADLGALSGTFQADEKARLQRREADERAAAEAIRLARLGEAQRPVELSQSRVQELQQSRDLARSDGEILAINRQIGAERTGQLAALEAQLDGSAGVTLTAEERRQKEEQIRGLQHEQAVSLREQEDAQRALVSSSLDRLAGEAQLAERLAKTEEQRSAAQGRQLAVSQIRLRELDAEIAAEGREGQRNALIERRYGLLGQIAELEAAINAAPLDAEQRQLELYKAQAQQELTLRGLGDDRAAQSQLATEIAARELVLANARVAAATTLLGLEAATAQQAQARLAFAQALQAQAQSGRQSQIQAIQDAQAREAEARARTERQLTLERALQDAAEARVRALAQISGAGDDAVQSAQLELNLTRERLALSARLEDNPLFADQRAELLKERLILLGQQAQQERAVTDARRARARLTAELSQAELELSRAVAGGRITGEEVALRGVLDARTALTRAEREYAQARADLARTNSSGDAERLKTATTTLTGAIVTQRGAVKALADDYQQQISAMDGVRDAAARLNQVAYGEAGRAFDSAAERRRLDAIQGRRDAAQRALALALQGGQASEIQAAAEELARQQERYTQQAERLAARGVRINRATGEKLSEVGLKQTQRLADQVDALGIEYDRQAVQLAERARQVDLEARAAADIRTAADTFSAGAAELVRALEASRAVEVTTAQLQGAQVGVKADGDRAAALEATLRRLNAPVAFGATDLDALARQVAGGARQGVEAALASPRAPDRSALEAIQSLQTSLGRELRAALAAGPERLTPPREARTTLPAVTHVTYNVGDFKITQLPGESGDALADRVVRKLEDRVRRAGRNC